MPIEVLMPALSPTMEKGNIAKWLKKVGDSVKSGDIIAEIETDKATMEVEAADEGTLGKILVPEGTNNVAVNTPIAVILSDGEKSSDIKTEKPAEPQKPAETTPSTIAEAKPEDWGTNCSMSTPARRLMRWWKPSQRISDGSIFSSTMPASRATPPSPR